MALEKRIKKIPEVKDFFTRIGTAEVATDPMPPSISDGYVMLKPREEWPDPDKPKSELVEEIEQAANEIPGSNYEISQPIQLRFNELISGVRSDVGVKIFGDDLDMLQGAAKQVQGAIRGIRGATDVKTEQVSGPADPDGQARPPGAVALRPQRRRRAERRRDRGRRQSRRKAVRGRPAFRHRRAAAGTPARQSRGDPRHLRFRCRPPRTARVGVDEDRMVRLAARRRCATCRCLRSRPSTSRRAQTRSAARTASGASWSPPMSASAISARSWPRRKHAVAEKVKLPPGYWIGWGGQFEQLVSATKRLTIVVPVALLLVLLLLFMSIGSVADALLVFSGVPLALTGGVAALLLRGIPLVDQRRRRLHRTVGRRGAQRPRHHRVHRAAARRGKVGVRRRAARARSTRLRPVLMTALVASLGFVPMAIATGAGAEVQRPLATVVIGGIISSTILTLLVLPALYVLFRKDSKPARADDSSAAEISPKAG